MQSCCLQPSPTCVELPYRILALIVAFNIAASPQRISWDCTYSKKSFFSRLEVVCSEYSWYGRPILATDGLLVLCNFFYLICFSVQASTSISSDTPSALSKLDRVKMFVELLIKTIRSDDMLAIVTFGTTARVVQPLRRMTDDAKVVICRLYNIKDCYNKSKSNFVEGEVADWCCFLANHKQASAIFGWGFNPQISFFSWELEIPIKHNVS